MSQCHFKLNHEWNEQSNRKLFTIPLTVLSILAGHTKHEMTSYSCMESVFKYFDNKLRKELL